MTRFHVHVAVTDLRQGIEFYSAMFGLQPAVTRPDYAKWMLEDPRLNFAISTGGGRTGITHLGLQTDGSEELEALQGQLQQAEVATAAEKNVSCCYARSNKYWARDPAGIAWETFHTLETLPAMESACGASTGSLDRPASAPGTPEKAKAAACCA